MAKFELTVSEREQEWSKDNEPLQGDAVTQSEATPDTPGFGDAALQSSDDTPGYGRDRGPLSPLSD